MVVFLIILAFFVALFTIRVKVTLEMKDELYLTVFAFGATLRILPKKPKKYKLRDYTPKKIAKRDAKKAAAEAQKAEKKRQRNAKKAAEKQKKKDAQAKLTKEQKKAIREKKRSSRPPIPDILELLFKIIRMFFSGFFAKFHFHVARIRIKIGSSDAATTALLWCTVSTALKPILILLDKKSNLHGMKNADISITTDYLSENISADIKLAFSMSLGGILGVALRTVFSFIFSWIKIMPSRSESPTVASGDSSTEQKKK